MAGCILEENWFEVMPTEIIVRIIIILDAYQINEIRKTSKFFQNIIDTHIFKYQFNKQSDDNDSSGYTQNICEYFNKFWMCIVKLLDFLQSNNMLFSCSHDLLDCPTSQHEDANPKSPREKIARRDAHNVFKY